MSNATATQFQQLPVGILLPSKTNPRKHFDEKQMEDLRNSVKEKGIVVPILVRKIGQKYEVVAGERRYRTARDLKLETVPCLVKELTDEQALEIQVIENLQRADVHPLDEAEGFQKLIAGGKHTVETIAAKVGKSPTWVYQTLKLNDLIPELKDALWKEKLNRSAAVYICRYSPEQQKTVFKEDVRNNDIVSLKTMKATIERDQRLLSSGPWKKDDATLLPAAGACNTCTKRTGASPSLFPEAQKNDACIDTECFMKKLKAFAQRAVDEVEESGEKVVTVQGDYWAPIKTGVGPKPIEHHYNMEYASKPGKDTILAVITEADEPSRIGKKVYIRKPSTSSSSDRPTSNRPSKAQLFKKRVEREAIDRIVRSLLEKAAVPQLPVAAFALIVKKHVGRYINGSESRGFEKFLGYKNDAALMKAINNPKTSIAELHKIILLYMNMPGDYGAPDSLEDFAKILKVDVAGIRAATKKEMEAAQRAKEKPKTKPKAQSAEAGHLQG